MATKLEELFEEIDGLVSDVWGGPSSALSLRDYQTASKRLGVSVPHIMAIAEVEAGPHGAFLPNGHPVILFERHVFSRETGGKHDNDAPHLSNPKPGGYGRVSDQPERLGQAVSIEPVAAIRSASWGLFQIMGFNFRKAGFEKIEDFRSSMERSAGDHLQAFVRFIESDSRMLRALKGNKWGSFARLYNGPGFKKNKYDWKLRVAYKRHGV